MKVYFQKYPPRNLKLPKNIRGENKIYGGKPNKKNSKSMQEAVKQ
jgi:hypothetical protein